MMLELGETDVSATVESLIDWWDMAGVTSAVSETPANWLQLARASYAPPLHNPAPITVASPVPVWPDTLDAFHQWLATETSLPELAWPQLSGQAKRILPEGPTEPALMVICDTPDADDMTQASLLSGDSGRLFDAMMAAIGLKRDDIYVASLAIARPAGGIISEGDSARLAARMRYHIGLVRPRHVLLLGDKTSRALLSTVDGENVIGLRALNHEGGTIDAIATSHPRFLLKQPSAKMGCWRQLQLLIEAKPA